MSNWVLPTVGYILTLGFLGVTVKLALRTITWQQIVLFVPIAYVLVSLGLVLLGGTRLPLNVGGAWAALTAVLASSGLILFFVALRYGDASKVVPISSAYPIVTVLASAALLSERITLTRGIGTAVVVVGHILLGR
jgi:transporter family protein